MIKNIANNIKSWLIFTALIRHLLSYKPCSILKLHWEMPNAVVIDNRHDEKDF